MRGKGRAQALFDPHDANHVNVRRSRGHKNTDYMSARRSRLFIPSQQVRPQHSNQSPVQFQPPPPPQVKPRKPHERYRDINGFNNPRYVPDDERLAWEQDRDALAMWTLEELGEAPPS